MPENGWKGALSELLSALALLAREAHGYVREERAAAAAEREERSARLKRERQRIAHHRGR